MDPDDMMNYTVARICERHVTGELEEEEVKSIVCAAAYVTGLAMFDMWRKLHHGWYPGNNEAKKEIITAIIRKLAKKMWLNIHQKYAGTSYKYYIDATNTWIWCLNKILKHYENCETVDEQRLAQGLHEIIKDDVLPKIYFSFPIIYGPIVPLFGIPMNVYDIVNNFIGNPCKENAEEVEKVRLSGVGCRVSVEWLNQM